MQLEPMLAKPVKRLPPGDDWTMEEKFDGWRALAGVLDRVGLWTRTGNPIVQVPYIAQALLDLIPSGTILDGELVDLHSATEWNRTESILTKTRGGYTHKPTASDPPLTYVLFDVLQAAGRDVRRLAWSERRTLLEELCAGFKEQSDLPLMLIPTHEPTDEALSAIMDLGFEGVVCKRKSSSYLPGRSRAWVKIKPNETIDAEFIGVYDPTPGSRFAPIVDGAPRPWAVGGLRFRVLHDDGRVYEGRAAGMDDRVRAELWEQPTKYDGYVVELAHWGVHASGALRSPQARRMRHPADKTLTPPANVPQTAPRPTREPKVPRPWMRNYTAMNPEKRRECIESLRAGAGAAYEMCVQRGGDPQAHLAAAERAAKAKGDPLP